MDAMIYMPPLRGAVLDLIGLNRGAVSASTLARIAAVAPDRALAFASILIARGALLKVDGGYIAGPAWDAWSQELVVRDDRGRVRASRPHTTTDPHAIAEMDVMRRAIAENVRAELERRGWSLRELARRAGVHVQYVSQLTRYATPPPACHLVLIARVLGASVEQLASSTAQMHQ